MQHVGIYRGSSSYGGAVPPIRLSWRIRQGCKTFVKPFFSPLLPPSLEMRVVIPLLFSQVLGHLGSFFSPLLHPTCEVTYHSALRENLHNEFKAWLGYLDERL